MPKIVGIHGIGQQYGGGYELRAQWLPSLKDGLKSAGHKDLAAAVGEGDLTVSYFGDLFRKPGALGEDYPEYTWEDLTSDDEIELVTQLYEQAVEEQPELVQQEGALGAGLVTVEVMVERLLRSRIFAGLAQRFLVGNFKQVTTFLRKKETKDKVLSRVNEEVDSDTRILIGHSLGSVVAYEYLCHFRPPGITLFITLGSPLGIRNVIFDKLTPRPQAKRGAWPEAVTSWVNVADKDDVVALRKKLAPLFPPPTGVKPIVDADIDNGDEPHAVTRYLNAKPTGAALATAL
jgi:hypothetical protein